MSGEEKTTKGNSWNCCDGSMDCSSMMKKFGEMMKNGKGNFDCSSMMKMMMEKFPEKKAD